MKADVTLIIFVLGLWLTGCGQNPENSNEAWIEVREERAPRIIKELGVLEAEELARIQTKVSGTIAEIHENGSRINVGDQIMKLDDEEFRSQLEEKIEELDQIREDLETEYAEYAVLTNSFQMTSGLKQAELDHALLKLKTNSVPLSPEEKRLGEIEVELAQLDLEDKKSRFEREKELVEKGFAPASSLQAVQREMEAAQTFLEEKQSQLALDSLPLPEEEHLTLETEVKNAEDAVLRNQEQQNRDIHIQDLKIEGLKLKIAHTSKTIEDIQGQLDEVTLISPAKGILRLTQKYHWSIRGWMPLSAGQRVRDLEIVGDVVDPNDLSLRVIIHESDFPLLEVGQSVRAKLTAYPGREVLGMVQSLTELGQDRDDLSPIYRQSPAIYQALFRAKIELENLKDDVIPGMTAVAEIQVESNRTRLQIPNGALRQEGETLWVKRRRNGKIEDVQVTGTERTPGWLDVTTGLKDGDEVLVKRDKS